MEKKKSSPFTTRASPFRAEKFSFHRETVASRATRPARRLSSVRADDSQLRADSGSAMPSMNNLARRKNAGGLARKKTGSRATTRQGGRLTRITQNRFAALVSDASADTAAAHRGKQTAARRVPTATAAAAAEDLCVRDNERSQKSLTGSWAPGARRTRPRPRPPTPADGCTRLFAGINIRRARRAQETFCLT